MSRIRSKNTKPELVVRRILHKIGFRYRLHSSKLPGKPDIVLPKYKIAVFVNGCFWHQHPGCRRATIPKKNYDYWIQKLRRNTERDQNNLGEIESMGWEPVVVWECEIKKSLDPREHTWLERFPKK